jgi:hypothetical protein
MGAPQSRFSLSMSEARFATRATFEGATFAGPVSFLKTVFQGPATFEGVGDPRHQFRGDSGRERPHPWFRRDQGRVCADLGA